MDSRKFLEEIRSFRHYRGQIQYIHSIPAREAEYSDIQSPRTHFTAFWEPWG